MNFSSYMKRAIEKMGVYAPAPHAPEETDPKIARKRIGQALRACAKHKIEANKKVHELLEARSK